MDNNHDREQKYKGKNFLKIPTLLLPFFHTVSRTL